MWYPEGIERLDSTQRRWLWQQPVCLIKMGPFKWLWLTANTHTQAQAQRHRTTNRPVLYLAEHRPPLGLIGSVDWFCPRVVRTLRALRQPLNFIGTRWGLELMQHKAKWSRQWQSWNAMVAFSPKSFLLLLRSAFIEKQAFSQASTRVRVGIFALSLLCSAVSGANPFNDN